MPPARPTPGPLDQFLTPEAMLTPGIAGATAMMITNALGTNFNMSRAWTALLLSFAFGLLSVIANKPLYTKILFYALNSLVIFCVASGANNVGVKVQQSTSLFEPAFAQSPPTDQNASACADIYAKIASKLGEISNATSSGQSSEQVQNLYAEYDALVSQGKAINGCGNVGGPNSVINNPGQLKGGPNSVFNNPSQFFKRW
jgi:hypothetical protein